MNILYGLSNVQKTTLFKKRNSSNMFFFLCCLKKLTRTVYQLFSYIVYILLYTYEKNKTDMLLKIIALNYLPSAI